MVLISNNPRYWLAGMAVSLVLFAVLFFTVIQPDNNTANQAVKSGLQQSQQALNQAQKQITSSEGSAAGASKAASNATQQATQQVNNASKLAGCLESAGTNLTAAEACKTKYVK